MSDSGDSQNDEARDSFPAVVAIGAPLTSINPSILASLPDENGVVRRSRVGGPPSVATTVLATDVGSTMCRHKDAFLKSFTFFKQKTVTRAQNQARTNGDDEEQDQNSNHDTAAGASSTVADPVEWGLKFSTATITKRGKRIPVSKKKDSMVVSEISGIFTLSPLTLGDYLKFINGTKIGPSMMNPERISEHMQQSYEKDGYLSVTVGNVDDGTSDILVHATVLKPRPEMTYEQMGMEVWYWGYLCIRKIDKDSIFKPSVLQETDHIVSVNDIDCTNTIKPEAFAHIVGTLDKEITITVLRRKQRVSGMFG